MLQPTTLPSVPMHKPVISHTTQAPPYSPTLINLNQRYNMSANSLTEALLLLSGMYISLVQPDPGPVKVGLHAVLPETSGPFLNAFTDPFTPTNKHRMFTKYKYVPAAFNISSAYTRKEYSPKDVLEMLCDRLFVQNTITVFYVNNHLSLREYRREAVSYLPKIIESLGLPIISYDTQFLPHDRSIYEECSESNFCLDRKDKCYHENTVTVTVPLFATGMACTVTIELKIQRFSSTAYCRHQPKLSIQLAPTLGQMMDVMFAFLRKFGWTDFSFLCTLSYGCNDELSFIRLRIDESKRKTKLSVYGVESYPYNLLSYVNFTDGANRSEIRDKLMYDLHKDCRINLVHGNGSEVKTILDEAAALNLTGKEYVWIFTYASITIQSSYVDSSYPLGSFVIAYNASREVMTKTIKDGVNLWLDALNSLATSADMDSMDFNTGFSCDRMNYDLTVDINDTSRSPLFWKYGEILYRYILKSKLPDGFGFDENGVMTANRFFIMNVQRLMDTASDHKEDTSVGRPAGRGGGSHPRPSTAPRPSRGSNYPSFRRHGEDSKDPASRFDRNRDSRFPVARDNDTMLPNLRDLAKRTASIRSSSSENTDSDSWPSQYTLSKHSRTTGTEDQLSEGDSQLSSSRDGLGSRDTDSLRGSVGSSYSGSTYSRDTHFRSRFSEGRDSESTSRNGDTESVTSHDKKSPASFSNDRHSPFTSRDNTHESHRRSPQDRSSDRPFKYGPYKTDDNKHGTGSNVDPLLRQNASQDSGSTLEELSLRNRNNPREPSLTPLEDEDESSHIHQGFRHSNDSPPRISRPYGHASFRLRDRRSVRRTRGKGMTRPTGFGNTNNMKHASYNTAGDEKGQIHNRIERATPETQIAKKIADWDGHDLMIYGIVWPGGENIPPKGKPEKYRLKAVTWQEDPHVIYREMKIGETDEKKFCDANSIECTIYNRNKSLQRTNGTKQMCCTGLCIDLLIRLGEMLNFEVQLSEVADGSYGSPLNENNTEWDGMLGNLIKKEADMAIGALSITPERSVAVDFTVPFLQTGITIVVALRHGLISATAFLEPYDYPSWSLILLFSVHATGASIFIFEWLSPYGLDQGKTSYSVHKFSLFRSFWLIWAMLFGASVSTDQPRGIASRFLANIWALFAVVFCASYTANLAAFMITKDTYYDLSGIQDWRLRNPHHVKPPFKFATIANSSTDLNIKKNYKDIYQYMKSEAQTDVKNAIRNLKAGDIQAFIYDSTTLEYEVGKDDGCKLKTVGKRIAETGYGVAFPKRSPWVKDVDGALLKLQENGEIERLQKHWLARACHSKKETGVSSHTLGILNFTSAFVLLGSGVVLGVLILLLEHMYFRFGRKSLRKLDKCGCCSLVSLSMGQSLTFEQSVMEAMDYHKHHRCKDPLCETQLWKVKHDLDIALLKISQLRRQLAYTASAGATKECTYGASCDYDRGDSPYQNGTARRRRQQGSDANQGKTEPLLNQPLLALEGKSDTDDDITPVHSPNHKAFASRPSLPVTKKPVWNDSKIKSRYSYPDQGSPRENNRRPSEGRLAKRNSVEQRNHTSSDDDIIDLDLRPPPPSFDEVMSRYESSPTDMTSSPSPPLPPPPASPPPPAAPSPPHHSPQELSSSTTSNSIPSSDNKRYEPFILDSPESPSFSSFSDTSDNRLLCPGTLSKLSDEVPSTALSQDVDSNFNSSPDISKSLDDSSNFPIVGYSQSQVSKQAKRPTSSVDNAKPSVPHEDIKTDTQMSLLNSLKEADNDVNTRQVKDADSNIYVNVDDIGGKETAF